MKMKPHSIVFLPVLLLPMATSLPVPKFEDAVQEKVGHLIESGFFGEGGKLTRLNVKLREMAERELVESGFHPGEKAYGLVHVQIGFKDKPDRAWWRGKEIWRDEEKVNMNTEASRGL